MLETLFQHTPDGVLVARSDGSILRANRAACALFQRTEEALQHAGCASLVSEPALLSPMLADAVHASERRRELTALRADGTVFPADVSVSRIASAVEPQCYVFVRDLSAERRAAAELAVANARFDAFMDASPAAKWMKDAEGRYLYVNATWEAVYGRRRADVQGRTDADLVAPSLAAARRARDAEVRAHGVPVIALESLADDRGGPERWWRSVNFLFVNAAGERFTGGIATDVTIERHAEVALRESEARARAAQEELALALERTRTTEEKFRQAQKMEAVGRLAGGVAHDFNNLLTVILSGCDVLREMATDEAQRGLLVEVERAAQRAAELTRQLLAFSRQQVLAPRVVRLDEIVRNMESLLRRLLGADIELAVASAPGLHRCQVDPAQIEQVILNLAVNARDAMPDGGRLTIETRNVTLDEAYVRDHPDARPGDHVQLTVSDTGTGMSSGVQARLFEPFFTTKPEGRGTGLGLSTVYGIVQQSGGTIWVYSEPGQGSTF
ncbi:MAG: PAS domain S-box protein [Gemmatimonadetes bacterium]|nr:PAS domain S-box protein [Gemmatimonadota bacterium]